MNTEHTTNVVLQWDLGLFYQQILYNSLSLVFWGGKKMARYVNVGKSFAKNYADLIVGY